MPSISLAVPVTTSIHVSHKKFDDDTAKLLRSILTVDSVTSSPVGPAAPVASGHTVRSIGSIAEEAVILGLGSVPAAPF